MNLLEINKKADSIQTEIIGWIESACWDMAKEKVDMARKKVFLTNEDAIRWNDIKDATDKVGGNG